MTMFEYVKEAYKSMQDKPKQERWQYFLDYYKWHAICIILAIAILVQGIVAIATRKDVVFSGILIDGSASFESETYLEELETYLQIDRTQEQVTMQTGISLAGDLGTNKVDSFQQILASFTTQSTDFITAPPDSFSLCAYNTSNMLADLRNHLDAETLAALEDLLYYVDQTLIDQAKNNDLPTDTVFPDPHAPETMTDPIPVGIDISGCDAFCSTYYIQNMELYLGMAVNTTRPEMVLAFLEYLGIS